MAKGEEKRRISLQRQKKGGFGFEFGLRLVLTTGWIMEPDLVTLVRN